MRKPLKNRLCAALTAVAVLALAGAAAAGEPQRDVQVVKVVVEGKGWLGVTMQEVEGSLPEALGLEEDEGVLVASVVEDSPAQKAGLKEGDVIVEFGGKEIEETGDLVRAVGKTEPGTKVDITVLREGKKQTLTAEIGERKDGEPQVLSWRGESDPHEFVFRAPRQRDIRFMAVDRGYLGVKLQELTAQLGEFFGVKNGEGALISEVLEDTPAAKAGLKASDVIVKIGDEKIDSPAAVHEALADTDEGDQVKVTVRRNKKEKAFDVTLAEMPEDLTRVGEGDIEMRMPQLEKLHRLMPESMPPGPGETYLFRHKLHDEGLDELKEQLDDLRQELKELKKELRREEG